MTLNSLVAGWLIRTSLWLMNSSHSLKVSSFGLLFPQGYVLVHSKTAWDPSHIRCGWCSWPPSTWGSSATLYLGISSELLSSYAAVRITSAHVSTLLFLLFFFLLLFNSVYGKVIEFPKIKSYALLSSWEPLDAEGIYLWNCRWWQRGLSASLSHPSAVQLPLTSIYTSAFPNIIKGGGKLFWKWVTMLITKIIFSSLFFPESPFALNTKSFLFVCLWEWGSQEMFRLLQILSDDKWEQIFFHSPGFTWNSVKFLIFPLKTSAVWSGSKWQNAVPFTFLMK